MNGINNIKIIPVGRAKDLTGIIFSRLKVLGRAPNKKDKKTYWWCKCQCGNIVKIRADQLIRGITTSCGCYKKEINKEQGKILAQKYSSIIGKNNKKDLIGKKFGHLTILKDTGKRQQVGNGTNVIWQCKCDCGNIVEVTGGHLNSGHTQSCGCKKRSHGEETIYTLLKNNNILFQQEYIFKKEKLSTGGYPRFDFFVNNQYVIEYDGEQHFNAENHGWNNKNNLKIIQIRDLEKNKICQKFNIPIIRIPYTHLKNLKIEDLLLTTSNFLIGG